MSSSPGARGAVLRGPVADLRADFKVPSSKSLTNRALIACAVADGGVIERPLDCEDTRLLVSALAECGWQVAWGAGGIEIGRRTPPDRRVDVFLGNSGTGARLVLALLAAVPGRAVVDGTPRLRERPMGPLLGALGQLGGRVTAAGGCLPADVAGRKLAGGEVRLTPAVSSQFVTALLMAAPLMRAGIDLVMEGDIPSRPYLDLTEDVLRAFGALVERHPSGRRWWVEGPLQRTRFPVEGDWSAAAFPLAAVAVAGGCAKVGPLVGDSRQGDRRVCDLLAAAGVDMACGVDHVVARGKIGGALVADLGDCPDLFPALSVVAAVGPQGSVLTGLGRLKHKESDRLLTMVGNLTRLGARVEVDDESFRVLEPLPAGGGFGVPVTAAGDHRIAMAMAVAALRCGSLHLDDPNCVDKSFPGFWEAWAELVR